jgi:hypothetical protein
MRNTGVDKLLADVDIEVYGHIESRTSGGQHDIIYDVLIGCGI